MFKYTIILLIVLKRSRAYLPTHKTQYRFYPRLNQKQTQRVGSTLHQANFKIPPNIAGFITRTTESINNKLSKQSITCHYCNGFGYVVCEKCDNGCWRCDNTKLKTCSFCNGTGKGRYAYLPIQ